MPKPIDLDAMQKRCDGAIKSNAIIHKSSARVWARLVDGEVLSIDASLTDIPALIAEIERLKGVIEKAYYADSTDESADLMCKELGIHRDYKPTTFAEEIARHEQEYPAK